VLISKLRVSGGKVGRYPEDEADLNTDNIRMFSASKSLFKNVPCPKQYDCTLPNCIFSHDNATQNGFDGKHHEDRPIEAVGQEYDPLQIYDVADEAANTAGIMPSPPAKRRKLAIPEQDIRTEVMVERPLISSTLSPVQLGPRPLQPVVMASRKRNAAEAMGEDNLTNTDMSIKDTTVTSGDRTSRATGKPASSMKTVSPPPTRSKTTTTSLPAKPVKVEPLNPRMVSQAPTTYAVRKALLQKLYDQMTALNTQVAIGDEQYKYLRLTTQELIKMALDEEEKSASNLSSDIYRNAVTQRIQYLKKMPLEKWRELVTVLTSSGGAPQATESDSQSKAKSAMLETTLSNQEKVAMLRAIKTSITGLDAYGYVTKKPSTAEIEAATQAVKYAGNFEICERCGTRFQVFPGRDKLGRLTTNGTCRHHWARIRIGQRQKTDRVVGQQEAMYPCCNKPAGSEGCSEAETHVFKVSDPKRLAAVLQFENTPQKNDQTKRPPVAFDCEMAYTTNGMEVIRVTAVSWPDKKELLDVLVRPYGEVLDLNTRFSGISKEQFAEALPYDAAQAGDLYDDSENQALESKELRKVESPAAARQLLFDLLAPETPLIGHAIDNDLNVCRIIHPFIIDTVLLFPHPKGLPSKYGLKMLSEVYLNRAIQMGGELGHDSKEDAIATGDLVLYRVVEKWKTMNLQGWKFEQGVLQPPGSKPKTATQKALM